MGKVSRVRVSHTHTHAHTHTHTHTHTSLVGEHPCSWTGRGGHTGTQTGPLGTITSKSCQSSLDWMDRAAVHSLGSVGYWKTSSGRSLTP